MRFICFFIPIILIGCRNPQSVSKEVEDTMPVYNYSVCPDFGAVNVLPNHVLDYLHTNMKEWVIPDTSDYNKAWWSFYSKQQIPYIVSTDLNDDNIEDYGVLLKKFDSIQLVILIGAGNTFIHWEAEDFKSVFSEHELQFGLMVQPPGRIDCVLKNEDKSLVLKSNGIALMQYEIMHKVYYWQNDKVNVFLHRDLYY